MRRGLLLVAAAGGLWGLAGYALLWGHTPVVVHRSFVVGWIGTVLLLPVRVVLWGIRFVEEHVAGRPFDFSQNNAWIGALAGVVGATLIVTGFLLVREVRRRRPGRRAAAADRPR